MMRRNLAWAAILFLLAPSATLAQDPGSRAHKGPGEGPRTAYQDESWEFWWFINESRILDERWPGREEERPDEELRKGVFETLSRATGDSDHRVRASALIALARAGDRMALPVLIEAIDDNVLEVRQNAIRSVGILGELTAAAALKEILFDSKRENSLRFEAAIALGLLTDQNSERRVLKEELVAEQPTNWKKLHDGRITALAYSDEGQILASAGSDHSILIIRNGDFSASQSLDLGKGEIIAMNFSPDGKQLVATSSDAAATVITLQSDRETTITDIANDVVMTRFEPKRGNRIALATTDGKITVQRVRTGKSLVEYVASENPISALRWSPSANRIAVGRQDGSVEVFFSTTGRSIIRTQFFSSPITHIIWGDRGKRIVIANEKGEMGWMNPRPGESIHELPSLTARCLALGWHQKDADILRAVTEDGLLIQSRAAAKEIVTRRELTTRKLDVAAFSPDGSEVALGETSGFVTIHNLIDSTESDDATDTRHEPESAVGKIYRDILEQSSFMKLGPSTRAGVAIGIGLTGDEGLADATLNLIQRRLPLNQITRAHLVTSFCRIGRPEHRDLILELLEDDNNHVRRSAALGLGVMMSGTDDIDLTRALGERRRIEGDTTTRNFISLAIGQVGGKYGAEPLLNTLVTESAAGSRIYGVARPPRIRAHSRSSQSFAALGLGLSRDPRGMDLLTELFKAEGNPVSRSALALAIGLCGNAEAAPTLEKALTSTSDHSQRSYIVLALAFLGKESSRQRTLRFLEQGKDQDLLLRSALALHINGDLSGLKTLLTRLDSERSATVREAVLYAAGRIGDRTAITPVLTILQDRNERASTRRYAAIALGHIVSQNRPEPWWKVTEGFNYPAETPRIESLLTNP